MRISDVGETPLLIHRLQHVYAVGSNGHTGVQLVSKSGCRSSVSLSPHPPQIT